MPGPHPGRRFVPFAAFLCTATRLAPGAEIRPVSLRYGTGGRSGLVSWDGMELLVGSG